MYLSEYVIATGDETHLPSIQRCADALVKRMTEGGRFGHAGTVGYGGKGLNIINTQAQLAWALAERAGELEAAGLRVLALSADRPDEHDAALKFLDLIDWPFERGWAEPELLDVVERTGRWPDTMFDGLISLLPKGEGDAEAQLRLQIVDSVSKAGDPHVYSSVQTCINVPPAGGVEPWDRPTAAMAAAAFAIGAPSL